MERESPYRGKEAEEYKKGWRDAERLRELSSQKQYHPAAKRGGTSPGCFVATAVFGEEDCRELVILRRFRDEHLLSSASGRAFVRLYYRFGPGLARHIGGNAILRNLFRAALVRLCQNIGPYDAPTLDG